MASVEVISLVMTAFFGVVSTVGVVYQVIEIRRRSRPSGEPLAQIPAPGPTGLSPAHPALVKPTLATPVPQHQIGPWSDPPLPLQIPSPMPRSIVWARMLMLGIGICFFVIASIIAVAFSAESGKGFTAIEFLAFAGIPALVPIVFTSLIGGEWRWGRTVVTLFLACLGFQTLGCGAALTSVSLSDSRPGDPPFGPTVAVGALSLVVGFLSVTVLVLMYLPSSRLYGSWTRHSW